MLAHLEIGGEPHLPECCCCFKSFIYFLARQGLCCCMVAFSSCSVQASHCGGFSCFRAQAVGPTGSVVVVRRLSCSMAWDLSGPEIEPFFPQTGRWALTTGTTREVPGMLFNLKCFILHMYTSNMPQHR